MEDDLKILKVEYLSNHLLDHIQMLNLSLNDQTSFNKIEGWFKYVSQLHCNFEIF